MPRAKEWLPGEVAEVWVQDRGATGSRLRGSVVIEDLSTVVTTIASRTGANGPQSPVTQYILQQAAQHLAQRLAAEVDSDDRESAPKMLSTALGHQPFIESVLEMSQHQMLRRWPRASDWYHDVVAYILRPNRFQPTSAAVAERLPEWLRLPFGDFVREIALFQLDARDLDKSPSRVADAICSLWPDYPPVREALEGYREQVLKVWVPFYELGLQSYGLHVAPGVMGEFAWAVNAMMGTEGRERLADPNLPWIVDERGRRWSNTGRAAMLLLSGIVMGAQGRYTLAELYELRPLAAYSN